MIKEILLLCDPVLRDDLKAVLMHANPALCVTSIFTRDELIRRCAQPLRQTRLVSFGSEVIVPTEILMRLDCGAYNFHPGPPTYPGRFPSSFLINDGGTRFGSTVHEMVAKVDAGPIHCVDWFDVPDDVDCVTLNTLSFQSLFALFQKLSPHLARNPEPLSHSDDVWSGRTTTQSDFNALCVLPVDVDEKEFQRRYRAVGEGPNHALEFTLHGHRFRLDNQHESPDVLIGGKKKD